MFHRKNKIKLFSFHFISFYFFCSGVMTRPGDYRMQQVCRATRRQWLILCVVREKKKQLLHCERRGGGKEKIKIEK
jgi:hypothetical protein